MKKYAFYIVPALSLAAVAAYYSPWYAGATRACLGLYILAFLWFLVAWVSVPFYLVKVALCAKRHDSNWKHHLAAAVIVLCSYVCIIIGMANNYMVTV